MQSDSAIAIDGIPSGVGPLLVIPDVSGFRRLARGYATSSDSYTFTREYGDYLGTGKTDSADLLWVVQHFNEPVPAGDWFMDVDDNGEITSAELLAVIQNFNHGLTGGVSSTDPILQGASQTAGAGNTMSKPVPLLAFFAIAHRWPSIFFRPTLCRGSRNAREP